nr:hypothetical protein [uncultured Clostridium sp.]
MSEKIETSIKVMEADIYSNESVSLLSELSGSLNLITGNSGESSFSVNDSKKRDPPSIKEGWIPFII